jgi:fido (protein-threonine AMPylation protein)
VPDDPSADPLTGVLRNRLGLSTAGELETAEREITHAALIFVKVGTPSDSRPFRTEVMSCHRLCYCVL